MSFPCYLRSRLWELLCCIFCSSSLSFCILDGFDLPAILTVSLPSLFLFSLPILIASFCLVYNKRSVRLGLILLPAILLLLLLFARQHREDGADIFSAVAVLVPLSVFLLTRTWLGAGLHLALGILVISGSAFLKYGDRPLCLLCFLIGAACLLLRAIERRDTQAGTKILGRQALSGFLVCLSALLLALGSYQFIIRPLAPPTLEVKLITELKHLPVLKKLGVSSTIHLPDPGLVTEPPEVTPSPSPTPAPTPKQTQQPDFHLPLPPDDKELPTESISYKHKDLTLLIVPLALLLCVAGVIGLTLLRRSLRLLRIQKLPPERQVTALYLGIQTRLIVCGVPPRISETPRQWCNAIRSRTAPLLPEPGCLERCTEILERCAYGGATPTAADLETMLDTYTAIPALAHRAFGALAYIRLFFRM